VNSSCVTRTAAAEKGATSGGGGTSADASPRTASGPDTGHFTRSFGAQLDPISAVSAAAGVWSSSTLSASISADPCGDKRIVPLGGTLSADTPRSKISVGGHDGSASALDVFDEQLRCA
jgi:hypothetical protein